MTDFLCNYFRKVCCCIELMTTEFPLLYTRCQVLFYETEMRISWDFFLYANRNTWFTYIRL